MITINTSNKAATQSIFLNVKLLDYQTVLANMKMNPGMENAHSASWLHIYLYPYHEKRYGD